MAVKFLSLSGNLFGRREIKYVYVQAWKEQRVTTCSWLQMKVSIMLTRKRRDTFFSPSAFMSRSHLSFIIVDEGTGNHLIEFPSQSLDVPSRSSVYQHVTAPLSDNHLYKCSVCIFKGKQQELVSLTA